jgi:hypothetical protein
VFSLNPYFYWISILSHFSSNQIILTNDWESQSLFLLDIYSFTYKKKDNRNKRKTSLNPYFYWISILSYNHFSQNQVILTKSQSLFLLDIYSFNHFSQNQIIISNNFESQSLFLLDIYSFKNKKGDEMIGKNVSVSILIFTGYLFFLTSMR